MFSKIIKFLIPSMLILLCFGFVFGQDEKNSSKDDFPDGIKETMAKRRIKQDEKDFQDLVKRSEEAVQLSDELTKAYENNKRFSAEDTKKLEKLEKVVKKIRQDLGAEDDKVEENEVVKSTNLPGTLGSIKEKATDLLAELKKTGRFAISVVAVESSNAIFRLLKFLRFNKTR